ncbi:uncharacterized protein [Battus philenor]|uniref:uncharacterized protein n=1 Tax=Battus philenor TaxID=42288 RepID=UPI0035D00095
MGPHLLLLELFFVFKSSSGMLCYKCDPERTYGNENVLCEHFDSSARYVANCEHSSMCYKRITSLDLGNGLTATTIQRGCAQQTMSGDQKKINGRWRPVNTIYDAYEEGCGENPGDIERTTKTINCYCRGDMCNHVGNHSASLFTILIFIIGLIMS